MENQKYKEFLQKASKGELTVDDFNTYVLLMNDKEQAQDKAIKEVATQATKNGRGIADIQEEYPLLPPEADDLSVAVRKKGVHVLGGKKSNAYADKDLRQKVYMDIYGEIKRQYGLIDETGRRQSYKKLRRKYLKGAFIIVEQYEAPIAITNEIEALNELGDDLE